LGESVRSEEIFDDRYVVYRRDRSTSSFCNRSSGGGVLIAHKKTIGVAPHPEWNSEMEDIWVTVRIGGPKASTVNLGVVYVPPDASIEAFNGYMDNCRLISLRMNENEDLIILGDFNVPNIDWQASSDGSLGVLHAEGSRAAVFSEGLSFLGLKQYNSVRNNRDRLLDLIVSSVPVQVSATDGLVSPDLHHPPLLVDICLKSCTLLNSNPEQEKYNFNRTDYLLCRSGLSELDWSALDDLNCNDSLLYFYNTIWGIIERTTPKKRLKPQSYPVWYSLSLIKMLKEKKKFHKKFKIYGNQADGAQFSLLRSRIKKTIRDCYKKYISSIEDSLTASTKSFWGYVKSKNHSNSIPRCVAYNGITANDGTAICDLFSHYFSSVFVKSSTPSRELRSTISYSLGNVVLQKRDLLSVMKSLDVNKGTGVDDIPNLFIKNCAEELVDPILRIFQKSLVEGVFPELWKTARITPIFKSGDKSNVSNYRPISLLSSMGKIFEKLVYERLFNHISPFLCDSQHGFISGKSTGTNLVEFVSEITACLDARAQLDAVYTDFSKAFDRVNHGILLQKLAALGIIGKLYEWLKSYLTGRMQIVSVNGFESGPVLVTSGVPQGSHLGPLLFTVFINDLSANLGCNHLLYADDLKLFTRIGGPEDCLRLQADLTTLHEWCFRNDMSLNVDKCYTISFTKKKKKQCFQYSINSSVLKRVTTIRDLGVTLDSELSFREHYTDIILKSHKMLGFMFRITKPFSRPQSLITLYCSLVRSQLEYLSYIWSPYYANHTESIERVQRLFTRIFSFRGGCARGLTYYERLTQSNLESLCDRRTLYGLTFLYKLVNGTIRTKSLESINLYAGNRLRNQEIFRLKTSNNNVSFNSPLNRMMRSYNAINREVTEVDLFSNTLSQFRALIRSHLVSSYGARGD
jgi:hypothetical protein